MEDFERVDLVLVTHLAVDHLGDAAEIAIKFQCPVVCGAEVRVYLEQKGVPWEMMYKVPWGGRVLILWGFRAALSNATIRLLDRHRMDNMLAVPR